MNKSKALKILAAVFCIAAFLSCVKESMQFFTGTYGYATSGYVTCTEVQDPDAEEPLTHDFNILASRGILRIASKGDRAVLTMTSVGGEALVFDAKVDADRIVLSPSRTSILLTVGNTQKAVTVDMSAQGYKTGAMMVLEFSVHGDDFSMTSLGEEKKYRIDSCNIKCVANLQD